MPLQIFASPWWVNLLFLVPFGAFLWWRRDLDIPPGKIWATLAFGFTFGFVEAAVVVYLRAATGLDASAPLEAVIDQLNLSLLRVEFWREAATIVMLLAVAYLGADRLKERSALFLAAFATWDLVYYAGLWLTIGWPSSLLDPDVLFLIPVPWTSQVWYPILVSGLTLLAVFFGRRTSEERGKSRV